MNKLIVLSIVFLLIWGGIYAWFRAYINASRKEATGYRKWIQVTLSDMFYNPTDQQILRVLLLLTILGGVIGFLLPGKLSQVDKILTIDQAIELNEEGKYVEAILILEELKTEPSPIIHNELGVAYLGAMNYGEAEKALKRSVFFLPHYGKAHENLATLYHLMGRETKAAFEESRAIESGKFSISKKSLYNLSDNLTDQLKIRILVAFLLGLCGYQLPKLVIMYLKRRRRKQFDEQLADGLVMISNGLRAGFSIVQAIEMVAKEANAPLSQEFELVLREHRLGSTLKDAFSHMVERIPSKDTKIMVNATLILLESGGNLPERFDTLAQTIQERKRVQQKIRTMTAEGETQAWILAGLPLVLGLILNTMNEEVFSLMYTTVLGWMIMILIVIMEIVGLYWMLKIVKVRI